MRTTVSAPIERPPQSEDDLAADNLCDFLGRNWIVISLPRSRAGERGPGAARGLCQSVAIQPMEWASRMARAKALARRRPTSADWASR